MADDDPDETVRVLHVGGAPGREAFERASGVEVVTARDGAEGQTRATAERVDCVVSAVELPDGSGLEFLRWVGEHRPSVARVLAGTDGDEETAVAAVRAGVTDYVPGDDGGRVLDRVRAAAAERREREGILDRMTDAFLALDLDWRFTYLNERGRQIICEAAGVDATADELLGEVIWELIPEAVDTAFYERYHEAVETGEPAVFEDRYEPLDTWFEVRAYPSSTGLSVYFRDVTEQRAREHELKRRERVLTGIHTALADKEASLDAKVSELLRIGREALGTDYGALSRIEGDDYVFEVVDDPTGETQPGDVVPVEATNCEHVVATEEALALSDVAAGDPDLTDRAGYTDWGIECYVGTPVVVEGEVRGTFCFYDREPRPEPFDEWEVAVVKLMGDWISYERERERRERALERERDRLDEFAGMISHDLRNPLNVAAGRLDLAAAECDSEHLDHVATALDRMDELVDDVLTVAQSGARVDDPQPVDFGLLARQAWATVGNRNGTLEVESDGTVQGDESRLRRALENLFRNSIEHGSAPSTGDPAVTVRVGVLDDGRGFYVEDDGPGIPPDEREEVFRSGYTTRGEGTGFGLAIVAEVVEAHGGEVAVTAGRDGGARFEVTGIQVE